MENREQLETVLSDMETQRKNTKPIGTYGIKFLDDYLSGILPNDFIMIGAESGVGKSELAYELAFRNSERLRVHLFALECDMYEPYNRMKYKIVAREFFKDSERNYQEMNLRNYQLNLIDVDKYIPIAEKEILDKYSKLHIHYREHQFAIGDLIRKMGEIKDECDMIVLDHIDYFDLDSSGSEVLQMTEIMKQLRSINLIYQIPVVFVSHLRKKSNRKQLIPDEDDYIGSSSKVKQSKTVITLAKDKDDENYADGIYGTLCHIAKGGRISPKSNLVGKIWFNIKTGCYGDKYELYRIKNYGETLEQLSNPTLFPKWAEGATKPEPEEKYKELFGEKQ